MMVPLCASCKHLRFEPDPKKLVVPRCDAFPKGIPTEIGVDGFDHRNPFPGDNGITWELNPGNEDMLRLYEAT